MAGYLDLLEGIYRGKSEDSIGAVSAGDGKVLDGVRYHVLDVWVDGLVETEGWERPRIMRPIERLRTDGTTKVVRERATEVLEDKRLQADNGEDYRDEEFEGFTD